MMPTTLKPSKQATEIRQASLVEAALLLAAHCNPSDITTGELAKAVGITQGAVFRHFASKEALWLAVLEWASDTLMAELQTAGDTTSNKEAPGNSLAALQAVFIAHINFVIAYPAVPRIVFQELQHAEDTPRKACVRGLMQRYRQLVAALLFEAKTQNLLAPDTDLQAAAVLFVGSVQGLVMQSLTSGQLGGIAAQAPSVFAIYLRGLTLKEAP